MQRHHQPLPPADEIPLEEEVLDLLNHILTCGGLDLSAYRLAPLMRRIPACLRAFRAASVEEAHCLLLQSPMLLGKAMNALLIGTTNFFRDAAVFDDIRRNILPELHAGRKAPRIWSVACSDGSELYSMALMLQHAGILNADLLGSDCREDAIFKAQSGIYPAASLDDIPAEFHALLEIDSALQVRIPDVIRSMVRWEVKDALKLGGDSQWDMILCRNFSIYLDSVSAIALWEQLEKSLAPGGFLVVGKAEKPKLPSFQWIGNSIYQKSKS